MWDGDDIYGVVSVRVNEDAVVGLPYQQKAALLKMNLPQIIGPSDHIHECTCLLYGTMNPAVPSLHRLAGGEYYLSPAVIHLKKVQAGDTHQHRPEHRIGSPARRKCIGHKNIRACFINLYGNIIRPVATL